MAIESAKQFKAKEIMNRMLVDVGLDPVHRISS
jgi:hypothetical protein